MRILIIVPAFNEELNISGVVTDIRNNCPECDCIVVNDCSTDTTYYSAKQHGIPVLNLVVNLGIGGAVQAGYKYAICNDYDIAVQFDGDGQHDASYLNSLVEPLKNGMADISIGSRFLDNKGFQSTGLRRFGIGFLSRVIKTLCGADVKDVTSGMRAVNRRAMEFFAENYAQDFPEPEAVMSAAMHGFRIVEVPVEMRERQNGTSSINSFGSVYYMIKVTLALFFARLFMRREN